MSLIIKSKLNEELLIGQDILIRPVELRSSLVRLQISAPRIVGIRRDAVIRIWLEDNMFIYRGLVKGKKLWRRIGDDKEVDTLEAIRILVAEET